MDQPARSSIDIEPKDRAGSSEPCSTRPNPFDDDGYSARKRRRTSINGASPSRSVGTPPASCSSPVATKADALLDRNDHCEDVTMTIDAASSEPQTPQQSEEESPPESESKPSRITLHIKSDKMQIAQSPSSSTMSHNDLDQDFVGSESNDIRRSVEDNDSDDVHGSADFADTASLALDDTDNLPIEIIDEDEDEDEEEVEEDSEDIQSAAMAAMNRPNANPMKTFPRRASEPVVDSLPKLLQLLEGNLESLNTFLSWMRAYIGWAARVGSQEQFALYKDYREFWQLLPSRIFQHTGPHKNPMARNAQTLNSLLNFHMAFAQLTAIFVDMDCAEMCREGSEQGWREPASAPFLWQLCWLLKDYAKPTPGVNHMDPDGVWPEASILILDELRTARRNPNTPPLGKSLYTLGHGLAELLAGHPRFVDGLAAVVQQIAYLVCDESARPQSNPHVQSEERARSTTGFAQAYRLFKAVSGALQTCIDKHVNQITQMAAETLILALTNIFRLALREGCEPTADLVRAHQRAHDAVQRDDTAKIIVTEWRFEILTKLLMSSQMSLRIIAAQNMCADLVEIWYENRPIGRAQVLRHFSNELMQSGVIDYILGPTCHPEVTTQSYNIIGFLFASQTMTQEHLDLMWRTATTCQISGVSDSLLAMVGTIANLFQMSDFLSLCRKLQSVPIESFTPQLKDFCEQLIQHFTQKYDKIQDLLPYSLVFRLLRESSVPGPPLYQDIQKWASNQIPHLLRHDPKSADRQLLQQECLKDITDKTRYALGSIHALGLLYRPVSRDEDMQQLILQHDLPRLLVHELAHAIASRETTGVQHAISGSENAPRLHLLGHVVFSADSKVLTDELGRELWELLVGQGAASEEDRDCAWLSLNRVMGSNSTHPFLETCFREYFPTLPPNFFRPGTLQFVLHKVLPLLSKSDTFVLEDAESDDRAAIEQLWRVALIAPRHTIEQAAITALVKDVYLVNKAMQLMPVHRARNIHLALVSRCMQQLSSAARQCSADLDTRNLKGPDAMQIPIDEHQNLEQEQLFTRSLTIVTEFHKLQQQIPRFSSPDLRTLGLAETKDVAGESAELKVQSFDGQIQTDVKPLPIGRLNTAGSLLASIRSVTGFDNYRLYYKGQPFTPSEEDICRSLEDLRIHQGLILVKRETDAIEPPTHVRPGASPVEIEIMRHFHELWQFLALKETLAERIYDFLITLPVDERILSLLTRDTTSYQDIFPIGQPLKSLYTLHSIQVYLASLSNSNDPSDKSGAYGATLQRILKLVVSAIFDRELIDSGSGVHLKAELSLGLVKQLTEILTNTQRAPSTGEDLDWALVERLNDLLVTALASPPNVIVTELIVQTFNAILEICTLKADLWELLCPQERFRDIVQRLLIEDERNFVRLSTANSIKDKITKSTMKLSAVPAAALQDFFWPMLLDIFPRALEKPALSLECFQLATEMLVCAKSSRSTRLDLRAAVGRVYGLLDSYCPYEVPALTLTPPTPVNEACSQSICRLGIDRGAFGLVLLLEKLLCGNTEQEVLDTLQSNSGSRLFARLLFPLIERRKVSNLLWPHDLVFNETTRGRLNNVILALAGRDEEQLKEIFKCFHAIVPCATNEGFPYPIYGYDLPFDFDRAREIRAACGYAGLRNLSNTCYVNSLCTQLFMNIDFRRFMLGIKVDWKDGSKALLLQTQNMFGRLQSSHHRFVDPEYFVASIKTYDDDLINVNNQMDVEEFFNLLNDRWEAQLRSPDKEAFRAFYGGKTVTQTKSKECNHISEVIEPFSVIQCDIKGKKNLPESLEAYVNGEHMEGDNKYKCSSCDRHVDAVRRTSLKEIPDSLIFHLKRFDYNIRSQSRHKINDYFAFPTRINMRTYTVEHMSNSPGGSGEDIFVLVGVLVHAGTAESGHYYSYIRERPSSRPNESWFEFNDDNVSFWDPSNLEACCFGGPDSTWDGSGVRYEKNHSAYMLFYERASSIVKKQQEMQRANMVCPVQVPVPDYWEGPEYAKGSIKGQNQLILQRHCLFDPDHLRFFISAIDRLLELNNGACSEQHEIERLAIEAAIVHLDQVVLRTKDAPGARQLANLIQQMIQNCPQCAVIAFAYLSSHQEAFKNMVQRCPDAEGRRCAADILIACLQPIKDALSVEYYASSSSDPAGNSFPGDVVSGVCGIFDHLWESLPLLGMHRAWPEVFSMMTRFVEMGQSPFVDEGERDPQFNKFASFLHRRPNRQPSYAAAIGLLESILARVTVRQPVQSFEQREMQFYNDRTAPLRLLPDEVRLLQTPGEDGSSALIDKLICTNQNVEATDAILAHILKEKEPMDMDIYQTLRAALSPQQSYMNYGPYFRVAEQYCHLSHHTSRVRQLTGFIVENSQIYAVNDSLALWSFFRTTMNSGRLHSGESKISIAMQSLRHIPLWAPFLLLQSDADISSQVETMLNEKIFAFGIEPNFEKELGGEEMAKKTLECARSVGIQCCHYARESYILRNQKTLRNTTFAVVQRVLVRASNYFDNREADGQVYFQNFQLTLDKLRRLIGDDLEDEGSDEWENSGVSSDQADSGGDDEMKEDEPC